MPAEQTAAGSSKEALQAHSRPRRTFCALETSLKSLQSCQARRHLLRLFQAAQRALSEMPPAAWLADVLPDAGSLKTELNVLYGSGHEVSNGAALTKSQVRAYVAVCAAERRACVRVPPRARPHACSQPVLCCTGVQEVAAPAPAHPRPLLLLPRRPPTRRASHGSRPRTVGTRWRASTQTRRHLTTLLRASGCTGWSSTSLVRARRAHAHDPCMQQRAFTPAGRRQTRRCCMQMFVSIRC